MFWLPVALLSTLFSSLQPMWPKSFSDIQTYLLDSTSHQRLHTVHITPFFICLLSCLRESSLKTIILLSNFPVAILLSRGMRWRRWLSHCATSREVASSIPDGVFHWHNHSGRTMALGLTQPLKEMSKIKVPRNRPEGPEGGRGIVLLFLDLGARRGWVVSTTPRPLYPWERLGTHCTGG
jgi:hypothetical protein